VPTLKKILLVTAILALAITATVVYLLRGGFRNFEIAKYPVPSAAFTNWNDVLAHPRDISLTTFRTSVVRMDACVNLDPASPKQRNCDHTPRDLAVLAHWVHHPRLRDFLIDAGVDDSFAKQPPYGSYTAAMSLFNRLNFITNRQEPGEDLQAQLAAPEGRREGRSLYASPSGSHSGRCSARARDGVDFRQRRSEFFGERRRCEPLFGQVEVLRDRLSHGAYDGATRTLCGSVGRRIVLGDLGAGAQLMTTLRI
jgi:hypothetical protein